MDLKLQKKLASSIAKAGAKRVKISPEAIEQVKQAITKADIETLIKEGIIRIYPVKGTSRCRARKKAAAKKKGRQKGIASKKGKKTARNPQKAEWMNRVRLQRKVLKTLREKKQLDKKVYRNLYLKVKGGFFRSKKHLLLYIDQKELVKKEKTESK